MSQKIYDIKPPRENISDKKKESKKKKRSKGFFASVFIGLFLIFGIFYFFSYRVEIEIWPRTEGFEMKESFSAEAGNKEDREVLNAVVFETDFLEDYKEFKATGTEDSETKATGTVTIQNRHWDQSQPLVEGTRFESEDGKIFRSENLIIVPSRRYEGGEVVPGEIEVDVRADNPGEAYNIDPGEFTIPGLKGAASYQGVTAVSRESMIGGAIGERIVISEEDLKNAKEEVLSSLSKEGRKLLESKKEEGFLLKEDSQYDYEIEKEEISGRVGESVENFSVKIRAGVSVITIQEEDLKKLIINKILEQVEENNDINLEGEKSVYEDSISFSYEFSNIDWENGRADIEVEFAGEVYSTVNQSRLIERAMGSSREYLKEMLNDYEFIRSAEVRFRPFGIGNIPEDNERIKVNISF